MDVIPLHGVVRKPAKETPTEHMINGVFSLASLATVVGLWIHFR